MRAGLTSLPLLRPFRGRDFRLLFTGETVSLVGDQFHFVALAWLVLQLTGSGLALGAVLMAAAIPRAALMLVGGAITDRFAPRRVLLLSNGIRAIVVAIVALLVLRGSAEVWQLVALGLVFGSVEAFFYPALQAMLPRLTDPAELPAANGLLEVTRHLSGVVGPAVAGVVVAAGGTALAFLIDALSFGVAFAALVFVRAGGDPVPSAPAEAAPGRAALLGEIRHGIAYAAHDPAIRAIFVLTAAFNLALVGSFDVGLPWLASHRFEGGAATFGAMVAGLSVGGLVGALLAGVLPRPRRVGSVCLGLALSLGLPVALVGSAPSAVAATALIALVGAFVGYTNVMVISWLQARVEPSVLGRVMSLVMLGSTGLVPVSLAIAGVLIEVDLVATFAFAGALISLAALGGILSGARAAMDDNPVVARDRARDEHPVPTIDEGAGERRPTRDREAEAA